MSRVVAPAALLPTAEPDGAERIAENGPLAIKLTKELAWRGLHQHPEDALRFYAAVTALIHADRGRQGGPARIRGEARRRGSRTGESGVRHPLDRVRESDAASPSSAPPPCLHKAGGRRWRSMVEARLRRAALSRSTRAPRRSSATRPIASLRDLPGRRSSSRSCSCGPTSSPAPSRIARQLGVPAVVVITAGFGETGRRGQADRAGAWPSACAQPAARMIGPNCAGLFSASGRVNALGLGRARRADRGDLAERQHGADASRSSRATRASASASSITVGNAADVRIPEYLDYLFADPETKVDRGLPRGLRARRGPGARELMRAPSDAEAVIVLKPGETESGRRAALSHTGVARRPGTAWSTPPSGRRASCACAESEEAWDAAIALALLPPLALGSVVVISDGGGHATIVCDAADRARPRVPDAVVARPAARLGEILPARSGIANPVDFAGLAEEEPEVVPARARRLPRRSRDRRRDLRRPLRRLLQDRHARSWAGASWRRRGGWSRSSRRAASPDPAHDLRRGAACPRSRSSGAPAMPVYRSLEASAQGAWRACWRHAARAGRAPDDAAELGARRTPRACAAVLARATGRGACSSSPTRASCSRCTACRSRRIGVTATPDGGARPRRARSAGPLAHEARVAGARAQDARPGGVLLDVTAPRRRPPPHTELPAPRAPR